MTPFCAGLPGNSLADYKGVSSGFGWVFRISLFFVLAFCQ